MLINFNHLKTFYNALVQKLKGFRGNWNQNDPSADDYIKNRPFYSEGIKEQEIVSERIVEGFLNFGPLHYAIPDPFSFSPILGESYVVTWDEAEYEVTAANAAGYVYIGNENYVFMKSGGSIPFTLINTGETLFLVTEYPSSSHTIKIVIKTEVVHKLDKKFIDVDMPDNVITEDSLFPILEDNLAPVTFTNSYNSLSDKPAVVQYDLQDLTDDQRAQARENIDVYSKNEIFTDYPVECHMRKVIYHHNPPSTVYGFNFNNMFYYRMDDKVIKYEDVISFDTKCSGSDVNASNSDQYIGTNCYKLGYAIVVLKAGTCSLKRTPSSAEETFTAKKSGIYLTDPRFSTQYTYTVGLDCNYYEYWHELPQTVTGVVRTINNNSPDDSGNITLSYDSFADRPQLSSVATSGNYNDLNNIPTDLLRFSEQTLTSMQKQQARDNIEASDYRHLQNKPHEATMVGAGNAYNMTPADDAQSQLRINVNGIIFKCIGKVNTPFTPYIGSFITAYGTRTYHFCSAPTADMLHGWGILNTREGLQFVIRDNGLIYIPETSTDTIESFTVYTDYVIDENLIPDTIARTSDVNELKENGGVGYTEGETVHTIDPKFLPETIVTNILYGQIDMTDMGDGPDVFTSLFREMPKEGTPSSEFKKYLLTAVELEKILSRGTPFCIKTVVSELVTGIPLWCTLYPNQAAIVDGVGMIQSGEYTFYTAESPTYDVYN